MSFIKEFFRNAVRIIRICYEPTSNDSCTFRVYLSNAVWNKVGIFRIMSRMHFECHTTAVLLLPE